MNELNDFSQFLNSAEAAALARMNRVVFVRKSRNGAAPKPFSGTGKYLWLRDEIISWILEGKGAAKKKGAPKKIERMIR